MRKKWQVVCVFIGIFLAGAVVGSMISVRIVRETTKHRTAPDQFSPQVMKRLVDQLQLTPEQSVTIQPIVTKSTEEIKRVRRDAFRETIAIFEKMDGEVAPRLTDEQRIKLKELQEKQRQKAREWMAQHGKREGDRPPKDTQGPLRPDAPDGPPPPPPGEKPPSASSDTAEPPQPPKTP